MNRRISWVQAIRDPEAMTLFALARIPRCSRCPRLEAWVARANGGPDRETPVVPHECRQPVCEPLARRLQAQRLIRVEAPLRWVQGA